MECKLPSDCFTDRIALVVRIALSICFAVLTFDSTSTAATLPTGFSESLVANGLTRPTAMAFAPDGRLFVCEQTGSLRVIKLGSLLASPFVTVTVSSIGEQGLLGVAIDPNFSTNQFVYIYYTATSPTVHNRVSRFTASGDVAESGSEIILFELNDLGANEHNGGAIHFGPDGKLYFAAGENLVPSNSQSIDNLLGKILRINPDGTIPADNPTSFPGIAGTTTGVNRAIWNVGLRNPYTFSFQPGTGRMFINDVGQSTWEEINEGVAGSNYGWSECEGPCSPTNPNYRDPLFKYGHGSSPNTGCAITGGSFYNPANLMFPADNLGKYFYGEYCTGWIRRFDPATGTDTAFASGIPAPLDIITANDGSLYYLANWSGSVHRVVFDGPTPTPTGTPTASPTPAPSAEFDLRISQTASPDPVSVGQPVTYTLTVSIIPTALGGTCSPQVRFDHPSGMPFSYTNANGTNGYTAQVNAQGVTFTGGTVSTDGPNVGTATFTVTYVAQFEGMLTSLGSKVMVDPNNLIQESDESNNTANTITTSVVAAGRTAFDYDGDRKADVSLFRPSIGVWFLQRSNAGETAIQFGDASDLIAPADFNGDKKTDIAVYRPSQGAWYIFNIANAVVNVTEFGVAGDLPVPGDYDGDDKADIALYRPSSGTWFVLRSSGGVGITKFGVSGDVPAPGDYDGDGKNDLALYRPSNGVWYERRSQLGDTAIQFGNSSDRAVPADYDGDGKMDIGVYRASEGVWYSVNSSNGANMITAFGLPTDIPTPGDYDGDGRADIAIYRPSFGQWWLNQTSAGINVIQFGSTEDKPTPTAFVN